MSEIFQVALMFFLIANPIGSSPAILALIKNFPFARQKWILFRESIIALALALFFQFFGEAFLTALNIEQYAVTLCGGTMLFIVSMYMIFPKEAGSTQTIQKEPFVVPIATPLVSGPGLLTIIMIRSKELGNYALVSTAIVIAWVGVTLILTFSPYLQKILGRKGIIALEQLMGMVLSMMAVEMMVKGITFFIKSL